VRDLAPADEKLEAIGQERIAVGAPRERRHFSGIVRDEYGAAQLRLYELLEQLELQLAGAVLRMNLDAMTFAKRGENCTLAQTLARDRFGETADLEKRVLEANSRKRRAEIEAFILIV